MKQTIDCHDFIREFESYDGRAQQLGGREGLRMLFDCLREIERDTDEEIELDVIGLCCDYACSTVEDIASDHGLALINDRDMTEEERLEAILEYINDHSVAVGVLDDGRILYQQF